MPCYKYITRKQANVIYANYKSGNITCTKDFINRVYYAVDQRSNDYEMIDLILQVDDIVKYLFESNYEFAQALIDGKTIVNRKEIYDIICVTEDMIDGEYWFYDPGDFVCLYRYVVEVAE